LINALAKTLIDDCATENSVSAVHDLVRSLAGGVVAARKNQMK